MLLSFWFTINVFSKKSCDNALRKTTLSKIRWWKIFNSVVFRLTCRCPKKKKKPVNTIHIYPTKAKQCTEVQLVFGLALTIRTKYHFVFPVFHYLRGIKYANLALNLKNIMVIANGYTLFNERFVDNCVVILKFN